MSCRDSSPRAYSSDGRQGLSSDRLPGVFMQFKAMRTATTLALSLALMLVASHSAAAAARVVAPPGNSEADQYFETLPSAAGPRAPVAKKEAREGTLSAGAERALLQRGATGEALAVAVARTAPTGGVRGGRASHSAPLPASAVRIPGEKGLGALFPLILVATAGAAVAVAASHRRRRPVRR